MERPLSTRRVTGLRERAIEPDRTVFVTGGRRGCPLIVRSTPETPLKGCDPWTTSPFLLPHVGGRETAAGATVASTSRKRAVPASLRDWHPASTAGFRPRC